MLWGLAWGSVSVTQAGVPWKEPDSVLALAFLDFGAPHPFQTVSTERGGQLSWWSGGEGG